MELEDKISGRNVTDEMTKKKHKNEERKMRIKYEHSVNYLKSQGEKLMDQISFEETKSKDVLDEKLKLEQELIDIKEVFITSKYLSKKSDSCSVDTRTCEVKDLFLDFSTQILCFLTNC